MSKDSSNYTSMGLWTTSSKDICNEKNIGCSSYPAVPKTRCPPAKPPRRKLSFPCEKIISDATKMTFNVASNESAMSGPVSLPASLNQASKQNSSKENSMSPLDGSDYGSLQGDIWPPKSETTDPNWQRYARPSMQFCSTPSTLGYFPHPNYYTPGTKSTASIYFTPPSTPWNGQPHNLPFDLNLKKLPFLTGKVTPCHRRHHSDPQISLQRKPSLTRRHVIIGAPGSSSRRSHSFASSHGPDRLKQQPAFGCTEKHFSNSEPLVLVEEVRMLREICNKLWNELQQTQSRLEVLQNHSQGVSGKPKFSELLSEIYYAQKERDQAVQQRLELALKERDQALKEAEHMKELLSRCKIQDNLWNDEEDGVECAAFNNIEQVLSSLENCWSPSRLHQQREKLLRGVRKANEVRQQDLLNQLQELLEQKDHAVTKAQVLTQELEKCYCKGSSSWECNGYSKEERSKALHRMEELEDELESLRLCYSLQSPLEGSSVCSQLNLSPENLQKKLQEERRARIEAQKECNRLERWVSVLIKKLNGVSVGVAV